MAEVVMMGVVVAEAVMSEVAMTGVVMLEVVTAGPRELERVEVEVALEVALAPVVVDLRI